MCWFQASASPLLPQIDPLSGRRLTRGITEIPEERRIWPQDQPRVAASERRFISLHGAVERGEVPILCIGLREYLGAFSIACTAHLLSMRRRRGDQHSGVAVCARSDFLPPLAAQSAEFGSLSLPLGLHALVHSLAVLQGQVDTSVARR